MTATTAYRVEAHDGSRWGRFGVRKAHDGGLPEFCGLAHASVMGRAEAMRLRDEAARLCGGTLRVAMVKDA